MAKKHAEKNAEQKRLIQAQKERLDNFVVLITSVVLAVGVVLAVLYNYLNSAYVGGVQTFLSILQWLGVAAVVVFAVLGFWKNNNKWFIWCGVGAYTAVNCLIILKLGTGIGNSVYISGIAICYYLLALCLVAGYVYYLLAVNHVWAKKGVRIAFYVVTVLIAAAILAFAIYRMIPALTAGF